MSAALLPIPERDKDALRAEIAHLPDAAPVKRPATVGAALRGALVVARRRPAGTFEELTALVHQLGACSQDPARVRYLWGEVRALMLGVAPAGRWARGVIALAELAEGEV